MKVAFVGVKRKYQELPQGYAYDFNRYHLELPFYFCRDGFNDVTITTVDYHDPGGWLGLPNNENTRAAPKLGFLKCIREKDFAADTEKYDVVVHWRKWFPELYRPEAINVINCQDHSFSQEWQDSAKQAYMKGEFVGILCFPKWHKTNLLAECPWLDSASAFDGVTLGVDTDVYTPSAEKNPREMLWASDPGRGLNGALELVLKLYQRDRGFRLHVCWPDYCPPPRQFSHPAVVWQGSVPNGKRLWDLFNWTGVLPYTSTFREPSSRAHRQAQAAGSMVLYPPSMGTPSDLILGDRTGVVAPAAGWVDTILDYVNDGRWREIGQRAREYAVSENWAVQAQRFNKLFEGIRK